ncbi:MAG: helix-turn-helix domain-containing protein [Faecalibacterium sp.]|nr:helix-turn-helix domain-containing protein [Ruminococcus sp.]MCM1392799.1 helix-turn-helix domain-containing protein [Ruminococcus sp.]MCM1484687.1 helix-turn-helix domain-containing protein [Faecalibacterium sp.]
MYKEKFANNLKKERIKKGLNQNQIAKELETTQTTIAKYENGKLEPKIENIGKIADILECSIDYLMGRTENKEINK